MSKKSKFGRFMDWIAEDDPIPEELSYGGELQEHLRRIRESQEREMMERHRSMSIGGSIASDISTPEEFEKTFTEEKPKDFKPECGICALKGSYCKKHQVKEYEEEPIRNPYGRKSITPKGYIHRL